MKDSQNFQMDGVEITIINAKAFAETGADMVVEIESEDCGFGSFPSVDAAISHYATMALTHELAGDSEIAAQQKSVASKLIRWRNPELFQ